MLHFKAYRISAIAKARIFPCHIINAIKEFQSFRHLTTISTGGLTQLYIFILNVVPIVFIQQIITFMDKTPRYVSGFL